MNRRQRRFSSLGILLAVAFGSGCQNDAQMIVTAPRTLPPAIEPKRIVRSRDPRPKPELPKSRSLPPSNGVDVPIIDSQ